jgi:hypothetical protein
MIIPDVNLLLYANIDAFPQHQRARAWLEELLNGTQAVGLPTVSIFGFIRIATSPRVFDTPMAVDEAIGRVEAWLGQPHVTQLAAGARHLSIAFALLRSLGATKNLTNDVQLAAHAIENQAELHSNDTDFGRFPGVRWVNPIQ